MKVSPGKLVPPKLAMLKMRIMILVLLLLLVSTRVVILRFRIWDVRDTRLLTLVSSQLIERLMEANG